MYPITNKVRSFHGSQFENGCQRLGNPGSESKQHTTENKMESAMLVAFRQTTMNIIPSWSTALGPPWNCNQRLAHRAPLYGGGWASSRGCVDPATERAPTQKPPCFLFHLLRPELGSGNQFICESTHKVPASHYCTTVPHETHSRARGTGKGGRPSSPAPQGVWA